MTDEVEQWALRPVDAGMCRLESLLDGTLDYADLVMLNDYLDVKHENEWRAQQRA